MSKRDEHDHDHEHGHDHHHEHGHDHHHEHGHDHHHEHGHDHHHGHGHGHGHHRAHGSEHEGDAAQPWKPRPELERGSGRGKLLFLDCKSGIAGDMTVAALLDLGVPLRVFSETFQQLGPLGFHLHVTERSVHAIAATHLDVHVDAGQPTRRYRDIVKMIDESAIEPGTKRLAQKIFLRLAEAESLAHRVAIDRVHFHEVGAVDAIIDIVGAAAGFDYLEADVVCSPLPMGHGFIRAAHGMLFNPPPAVVHCLRGKPTYGVDLAFELVTPTGAAIAATVASRFETWPSIVPAAVGYGAGTKNLHDRPNVLRAVLGLPGGSVRTEQDSERYVVLEANLDDVTGEFCAHAITRALEVGALDAWAVPLTMKKGRPGIMLGVLCVRERADELSALLMSETTTLGVRRRGCSRSERPRRDVSVATTFGPIRAKVAEGAYGAARGKPEFDDCRAAAERFGVPVRDVWEAAELALRQVMAESGKPNADT